MTYDPGTTTAHDMDMGRRVHHPDVVRTVSGRYVSVLDPSIDDIDLLDIAHGLSMVCRYGGHVAAHYSVAEHSLNVAAQLQRMYQEPELTIAGLMHDASEAYIGDMVRPLKHSTQLEAFRTVEHRLEQVIGAKFNLRFAADPRIKQIDNEILPWEMAMIRDSKVRVAPHVADVRYAFIEMARELGVGE